MTAGVARTRPRSPSDPGVNDSQAVPFERSEPLEGVRLVTEAMPHVRSASVGLWVEVGSRDEPDELAGASHLLEHLLFKGTPTRGARDIAEAVDVVGGELNAYSAKEHTCYFARVLDVDLPMATDILCDMFRNALLRDADLEAERKVVLEEIAMANDSPEDRAGELFPSTLWPGHPLGRPVIGTAETVGAMDRSRLLDFYRSRYRPGRLVIAASGNVDHDALARTIAEALDPDEGDLRREPDEGPPTLRPRAVYEHRSTEQANLVWGAPGLSRTDPDRYALAVLNAAFGGGMSSRLFQEVREARGLAYAIYSHYEGHVESGAFAVYAGTREATAADVLGLVREQAADAAGGGISAEEVERAKGQVKGTLVLSMDDPGGRMARLGRAEQVHGEVLSVDELLGRVDAVTAEDVTRVAGRLFGGDGFVCTCVGPVASGTLDRFTEPL